MTRFGTGILLAALWSQAALAQAPSGLEPGPDQDTAPMIVIDGLEDPEAPAVAVPPSVLLRDSTAKSRPTVPWLLPLRPVSGRIGADHLARLQGQRSEVAFRLVLPATALNGTLTLSYVSSINVLPDDSDIEVLLNDERIGTFRPESFGSLSSIDLPLQGKSARAGENIVTLRASQRHRIYCGPEASFSLWTDIDLSQSGVMVSPGSIVPDGTGFVAALAAQAGGGQPLEIRGEDLDDDTLRGIATALGQATGGTSLALIPASPWTMSERPALARVSLIPSDRAAVAVRVAGDGALVLAVEYLQGVPPDPALISEALSGITPPLQLAQPARVSPGEEVLFADLGFTTAISSEYYFRRDLNFRLPDDWLILASQKATAELEYGFAEGLPENGLMLVKVNGTTVRMLPLDRDGGKIQPRLPVGFNARLLRPGVNALSFEAIIPGDPPDRPCPVRDTDMLTILDSSTLTVPPSPKMQQPDMARTLSGLGGEDVQVISDAADRSLPFAAILRSLQPETTGELIVAAFRDIPQMPLSQRGITAREIETLLLPAGEVQAAPVSSPAPATTETGSVDGEPAHLERTIPSAPVAAVRQMPGWIDRIWTRMREPVARGIDNLVHPGDGELAPWLAAQHGSAVLMALEADRPDRLWIVLGPDADAAQVAADLDTGRRAAGGPHGQISVLQPDGTWNSWTAPDARPRLLEPLRVGNLRPVLGNLVSWQPGVLTVALIGLAWLTALLALAFVVSTRGNRNK